MTGLIASIDLTGGYFSTLKIVVMLVLALPWLWVAPRAQKLANRSHEPGQVIGGVLLGAGAAGMLVWLLLPTFGVGMLIYVLLVAGSSLGYVVYHNGRVEPDFRILTRKHIHSVFSRDESHKIPVVTKLKVYDAAGRIVAPPPETAFPEDKLAYNLSQELLYDLLYYRASEADLAPAGEEAKLRFLVDGAIAPQPAWRPEDSERAIQYIKALADLDPEERRKPQRGTLSVDLAAQPVDMVITTAGTASGQRMQFRIVQESIQTRIEELGMDEEMVAKVRDANQVGGGLILVAARPKNGLTSTLYSLLRCHDSFTMQLTTLEAKV
ncbi:MAG: ATPase, T2SS/T4P/T4SS family, partial [Planctomycetota bacterium]